MNFIDEVTNWLSSSQLSAQLHSSGWLPLVSIVVSWTVRLVSDCVRECLLSRE